MVITHYFNNLDIILIEFNFRSMNCMDYVIIRQAEIYCLNKIQILQYPDTLGYQKRQDILDVYQKHPQL